MVSGAMMAESMNHGTVGRPFTVDSSDVQPKTVDSDPSSIGQSIRGGGVAEHRLPRCAIGPGQLASNHQLR